MDTPQVEVVDITDDRPLAVRRKRRLSTGLVDAVDVPKVEPSVEVEESSREPPKTPTKPKKRVRFSDPGPEPSTINPSSTGLTPYLKRTVFTTQARGPSTPRLLAAGTRRLSLPIELSASLPSPSLSPSPGPFSGEFQFTPLRQVLDDRLKRRLRRNNLSDEINDIDEERKSETKLKQEIQSLKGELAVARQSGKEYSDGSDGGVTSSERIRELEQQLVELRGEMRERSTTAEPAVGSDNLPNPASSPMEIYIDNAEDDFIETYFDDRALRDQNLDRVLQPVSEVATQVALPSPTHTEAFRSARISLEYLFPGEIALGLIPEDPKPLLEIMLDRMRILKAQAFMTESSLKASETQEVNLRNQFNAVLAQLDRARDYADDLSKRHSNEKARADNAQARVHMLETSLQNTSSKATEMAKDVDEKERSIEKLQNALESYRVEVSKLEMLISRAEGEHKTAFSQLRSEMDEAVADLECHVAAETRGRREAEQEVIDRDARINELKVQEQQLKDAVNEKQKVIRETEAAFAEEKTGREREVGGLNVTIGQLSTDLSESKAKEAAAEEKQQLLMRHLQEERDAGLRAVEAVQTELARCTERAEGVKVAHVKDVQRRGAEVTEHKGLLTPVSVTRFKDVEGYVEFRRGKQGKRPDSGIGVLEEDEDEEMIMGDM